MIRDITIGQYYPAQSPIHKLDPRVKLFATLIYIIALFSYKGIAGVLFIVAALAAVIKISKVPFKFMVKGLKSIIILLLFTACFSVFFTQGEYTIWEYGIRKRLVNIIARKLSMNASRAWQQIRLYRKAIC